MVENGIEIGFICKFHTFCKDDRIQQVIPFPDSWPARTSSIDRERLKTDEKNIPSAALQGLLTNIPCGLKGRTYTDFYTV